MAYSAGDAILDDEYNVFVASSTDPFGYNHFAGVGAGIYGLNQTAIATVSAGDTIEASSWNSLFTGLANIANHTNTSITASSVSAGDAVAIRSALVANLASVAAAVAAGSTGATALDTAAIGTSTSGGTFNTNAIQERSVTFASSAVMRAFFNGGGAIRVDPAISGSVDGDKDTVYTDLTAAVGNFDIEAHNCVRSGSGETQTSADLGNGFYDATTSYVSKLKMTSDNSGYTGNTIEIFIKLNAAPATATVMTIKMVTTDGADDTLFTAGNLSSIPANPNEAPAMVLNIIEVFPDDSQGLAADIRSASNAEVSNSVSS